MKRSEADRHFLSDTLFIFPFFFLSWNPVVLLSSILGFPHLLRGYCQRGIAAHRAIFRNHIQEDPAKNELLCLHFSNFFGRLAGIK
jgi:hypothetical protein